MEKIQTTEDSDDAGPRYPFIKKPLRLQRIYIYKNKKKPLFIKIVYPGATVNESFYLF